MKTHLSGSGERGSYPGYKGGNGYTQNLAQYAQKPSYKGHEHKWVAASRVGLTVVRNVAWDKDYRLQPFLYSVGVGADYECHHRRVFRDKSPADRGVVSKDEFIASLFRFDVNGEFTLNRRRYSQIPEAIAFDNADRNIGVSWNEWHSNYEGRDEHVDISVSSLVKVPDLSQIFDDIVPYALEVFHDLNPSRHIDKATVKEVADVAFRSDNLFPTCRIPGVVSVRPPTGVPNQ